jgi:hypothetical protein
VHHVGRIRHYSLDTSDWNVTETRKRELLSAGRLNSINQKGDYRSVRRRCVPQEQSRKIGQGCACYIRHLQNFLRAPSPPWCKANGVSLICAFDDLHGVTERFDQSWKHLKADAAQALRGLRLAEEKHSDQNQVDEGERSAQRQK